LKLLFTYVERNALQSTEAQNLLPTPSEPELARLDQLFDPGVWNFMLTSLMENVPPQSPVGMTLETALSNKMPFTRYGATAKDWFQVKRYLTTVLAGSGDAVAAQEKLKQAKQKEGQTVADYTHSFLVLVEVVRTLQEVLDPAQTTVSLFSERKLIQLLLMSLSSFSLRQQAFAQQDHCPTVEVMVQWLIGHWNTNSELLRHMDAGLQAPQPVQVLHPAMRAKCLFEKP
jgi:hypothetical protein